MSLTMKRLVSGAAGKGTRISPDRLSWSGPSSRGSGGRSTHKRSSSRGERGRSMSDGQSSATSLLNLSRLLRHKQGGRR